MNKVPGMSGLILNEPLLWEKGKPGRTALDIPAPDVPPAEPPAGLCGDGPAFPDLGELDIVRHYTRLSQWNFGIDTGMYPLGSCTMKYNPKINEKMAATPELAMAHPMLEPELAQGALRLLHELQEALGIITGLPAVSLQPAAGAHGELTGMLIFHAYHTSRGSKRTKILIPDTAHGTNPASAALCGYKPVPVASNDQGVIDASLIAELMDDECAGIMATNPNTLGLFEEQIREIADIVHAKGGLVYGDGANMNAVMGIIDAQRCGIDIMHLNLHKTFSTPHGGGGPGAGPVCVTRELERFLPAPVVVRDGSRFRLDYDRPDSIGRVHAFHGNFGVLVRAFSYIRTMGGTNLKRASQLAVLNANYIKARLKDVLHLPYDRPCMHECVFSDQTLQPHKVATIDLAKALIDCGFHPPTVYFPLVVAGAIMIEPTETECKDDIDQLVDTIRSLVEEAARSPETLQQAPRKAKVRRLDEATAARCPCLTGPLQE